MTLARRRLAGLLLLALVLALPACDEEDSAWDPPTEPDPGPDPVSLPVLTISVDGQEQMTAGSPGTATLRLENSGQGAADSVAVAVTLPELVVMDQALTDHGTFDAELGIWMITDLVPGTEAILAMLFNVETGQGGQQAEVAASVVHVVPEIGPSPGHQAQLQFAVISQPPVARDDAYTLDEGAAIGVPAPGVLGNDEDPNGELLTLQLEPLVPPLHGTMAFHADGSMAYAHDGSEVTADSLRYVVIDAEAARDTATVRFTITPVNDLPVLEAPSSVTIIEGQSFAPMDLDALVSDADHDRDQLQWQILGADELMVELSDERVLTVTTPGSDWNGSDTIIFRVRDPEGVPVNADVQFIVTSVNDVPVVSPLPNQSIVVGGVFLPIPLDNYVFDVDHDDSEMTWTVAKALPLLVTISPDRVLTVVPPNEAWTGSVEMTLRATDPEGDWDERQVRFEVTPPR